MDSLFGGEMTGAARFVIAFVVVLALIAISAWLVRRFGSGSLSSASGRGRQPRLAVIDAAAVDARRRLILVRRDNVEHLVMIGGPTDVVIEQNIVRATAASPRDVTAARASPIADTMPRAVSLDESAMWPLQPQPDLTPRVPRLAEPPTQWSAANEQTAEKPPSPPPTKSRPDPLPLDLDDQLADLERPPVERPRMTEPEHPAAPAPPPPLAPAPVRQYATPATDSNLAAMAQRLETVLRRGPVGEARPDTPMTDPQRAGEAPVEHVPPPASNSNAPTERNDPQVAHSRKFYETLEQEMASLLGRSTGKT